ncbi:MAG: hypothetical protein ACJAY2_001683 [Pseudomonadales bacterium]|jgi:hypothetical protein
MTTLLTLGRQCVLKPRSTIDVSKANTKSRVSLLALFGFGKMLAIEAKILVKNIVKGITFESSAIKFSNLLGQLRGFF